ncbi:hypothetical protein ANCDUO_12187 [Ancylostoma duodenale]|uniref:Uncharacterized protein n=1 Tax=Ancylostoma duodenale TaxID=51022 RepID=A0A0C2GFD9_9BILA|nr:hypothetical protein ANCDUO_12187 [Ancylostoma duodenale]
MPKGDFSPPVVPGKQRGPEGVTSPKPSQAGAVGAARTPIAAKDAKGVIMVEVSGPTKKDLQSKPSLNANPPSATAPSAAVRPQKSNDSWSLDEFVEIDSNESATEASSMMDDESQYSAVVHFKPNKFTAKTRVVEQAKDEKTEDKVEAKPASGDKKKEMERKEAIESKEVKKPEPAKKTQAKDEKPDVAGPATKKDEAKVEKVVPKPRILKEEKTQMVATIKSKSSSRAEGISAVLLAPMWG